MPLLARVYNVHVTRGPHWNYESIDGGLAGICVPPSPNDLREWARVWAEGEWPRQAPWRTSVVYFANGRSGYFRSGDQRLFDLCYDPEADPVNLAPIGLRSPSRGYDSVYEEFVEAVTAARASMGTSRKEAAQDLLDDLVDYTKLHAPRLAHRWSYHGGGRWILGRDVYGPLPPLDLPPTSRPSRPIPPLPPLKPWHVDVVMRGFSGFVDHEGGIMPVIR